MCTHETLSLFFPSCTHCRPIQAVNSLASWVVYVCTRYWNCGTAICNMCNLWDAVHVVICIRVSKQVLMRFMIKWSHVNLLTCYAHVNISMSINMWLIIMNMAHVQRVALRSIMTCTCTCMCLLRMMQCQCCIHVHLTLYIATSTAHVHVHVYECTCVYMCIYL